MRCGLSKDTDPETQNLHSRIEHADDSDDEESAEESQKSEETLSLEKKDSDEAGESSRKSGESSTIEKKEIEEAAPPSEKKETCVGCEKKFQSNRILGLWTIEKMLVKDTLIRVYLIQDNLKLCKVIFMPTSLNIAKIIPGNTLELFGWQRVDNRHNTVEIIQ